MIDAQSFWKWAFSDFLSNSLRGILAEYIVAIATDATEKLRTEWDAYDMAMADGTRIEVKSSAYLQSWQQRQHSILRFDIGPKKSWDATTNISQPEAIRSADVYVFCVFLATDRITANPLDEEQWSFLVCSSEFIARAFGQQKSVRLSSLEQRGLQRVPYSQLKAEIVKCRSKNTHLKAANNASLVQ